MKKLLQLAFCLSVLMMFSCEDPAEEVFQDIQDLPEASVAQYTNAIDMKDIPRR